VTPVAYAVMVVLILVVICNGWLIRYTETHPSVLREEPGSLLSIAGVIHRSNISDFVSTFFERHQKVEDIEQYVKEHYNSKIAPCYFDEQTQKSRVEELEELPWIKF
jgi:hypothetical protein